MSAWDVVKKVIEPSKGSVKPQFKTNSAYDIIGGDHLLHVQKRLDDTGESKNYEIVLPEPNELQIDYDSLELPDTFPRALDLLAQAYCKSREVITYEVTRSRSGNRHVIIRLPHHVVFDEQTRIAWQAVFGSDPIREGLSLMSSIRGLKNPTLLIEKKGGAVISIGTATLRQPEVNGRMFRCAGENK